VDASSLFRYGNRLAAWHRGDAAIVARVPELRAVVFDVDFTLARPGPDLGPEGYRRLGARYGLELDPARHDVARRAAIASLERSSELDHDEELWILFTERIIEGMGGVGDTYAAATEMTRAWERADHFELYPDVLGTIGELRGRGLKVALLSNTARDLELFVAHHGITVDALLTSRLHGKTKPHASIFRGLLDLLDVLPAEAVMVGDSIEDDIEGALAVGMGALLVDREHRYPDRTDRLDDLTGLATALGL
jgi:HAD superfamily hydrolase (TIGR01549 family)